MVQLADIPLLQSANSPVAHTRQVSQLTLHNKLFYKLALLMNTGRDWSFFLASIKFCLLKR